MNKSLSVCLSKFVTVYIMQYVFVLQTFIVMHILQLSVHLILHVCFHPHPLTCLVSQTYNGCLGTLAQGVTASHLRGALMIPLIQFNSTPQPQCMITDNIQEWKSTEILFNRGQRDRKRRRVTGREGKKQSAGKKERKYHKCEVESDGDRRGLLFNRGQREVE